MKIELNTTEKAIEIVNYVIGQAYDQLSSNDKIREQMDLTEKEVSLIEKFRNKLLSQYFKQNKQ